MNAHVITCISSVYVIAAAMWFILNLREVECLLFLETHFVVSRL